MVIIEKSEIKAITKKLDLIPIIKEGFIAYSEGKSVIPPIGELSFNNPPGDVHIKYGYVKGDKYFVIKIASGFYNNERLGIANGSGLMFLASQSTGQNVALLLDDAYLTDVRTAIAGAICAQKLSNSIESIGVIGTGTQARMQLHYLKLITKCRNVVVWGRSFDKLKIYKEYLEQDGFNIILADSPEDVARRCNLIITTTASTEPLLFYKYLQKGTHITAVGSDTAIKQELDLDIIINANILIADSIVQCKERGELSHGLKNGLINENNIIELGDVLSGKKIGRKLKGDISVSDLTGVAVQDIQIASAVYESYLEIKE